MPFMVVDFKLSFRVMKHITVSSLNSSENIDSLFKEMCMSVCRNVFILITFQLKKLMSVKCCVTLSEDMYRHMSNSTL